MSYNVPKLSVIIPVYNAQEYLEQCVESILQQSFNDFEIILVNDGSTDHSYQICNRYSHKFPFIKVFHTKNMGVAAARNYGLEKAQGEYIHFIDSDDTIDCNMYEEFNLIVQKFSYDLIVSGRRNFYLKNKKIIDLGYRKNVSALDRKTIANFLLQLDVKDKSWAMNVIWNKWFKRSVLLEHNIRFNTNICPGEDFLFVADVLMKIKSLYVLNNSYYNYYIRGEESLLGRFYEDTLVRRPFIHNVYKEIYKSYGIYDIYKDKIDFYEGLRTYKELFSIFKKKCNLNFKQKKKFIKDIIESKHFNYALEYLSKSNKRVTYTVFNTRNLILCLIYIYIEFLVKKILRRSI